MADILGDCVMEAIEPGGWPCVIGDRGGKPAAAGEVYALL